MEAKHPIHGSLPPLQLKPGKQTPNQPIGGSIAGINPMLMKPVLSESKAEQAAAMAMAMTKKSYNSQTHNPADTNGVSSSSSSAVYSPLRGGIDIDAAAQAKPAMNQPPMKPMSPEGMAMAQAKATLGLTGTGKRMVISAKPVPPTNAMDMSGHYVTVAQPQRPISNQLDEGKDATPSSSSQLQQQQQQQQQQHGIDQQFYQQQAGGGRSNPIPNPNLLNPKPILSTSRRIQPGSTNVSPYGTLQSKPYAVSEKCSVRFKPVAFEQSSNSSNSSQVAPMTDNHAANQALSVVGSVDQSVSQHVDEGGSVVELVPYGETMSSNHHRLSTQHSNHMLSNRGLLDVGKWRSSALLGHGQGRKAEKQPLEQGLSFVDPGRPMDSFGYQNYQKHEHTHEPWKAQVEKEDRNCRRSLAEQARRGWNMVMRTHASMMTWRNQTFSPAETK